ncbi:MAG: hypothetical protein FWC80_06580, partial [Firmicutes bacterium]|nr:hypothetical protein [Bacillota bacterium]
MSNIIRTAKKSDAKAILDVSKRAFEVYHQSLPPSTPLAALSETLQNVSFEISKKRIFVIESNSKIIGSIRYELLSP